MGRKRVVVEKPAKSVCAGCRESKVRCNLEERQRQNANGICSRCERLGARCEEAAPSLRGKRSATARLGPAMRARVEAGPHPVIMKRKDQSSQGVLKFQGKAPVVVVQGECHWSPMVRSPMAMFEEQVDNGFVGPNTVYLMCRTWFGIARQRNSAGMMQQTIGIASRAGISMENLLQAAEPLGMGGSLKQGPQSLAEFPRGVAQLIESSKGYIHLRSNFAANFPFIVNNALFEANIISAAEMHACWQENQQDILSLFVHPDDMWVIVNNHLKLFELAAAQNDEISRALHDDSPIQDLLRPLGTLRIWRRSDSAFVPCTFRFMMYLDPVNPLMWLITEFHPCGPALPLTKEPPAAWSVIEKIENIEIQLNEHSGSEPGSSGAESGTSVPNAAAAAKEVDAVEMDMLDFDTDFFDSIAVPYRTQPTREESAVDTPENWEMGRSDFLHLTAP